MEEPMLRLAANQPKTKIKLSTVLGGSGYSKNDMFIETPMLFADGNPGKSYQPIQRDEGTLFSYGLSASHYLGLAGLSDALCSTAKNGLEYMIEFIPFPELSDVPQITVRKIKHDLMIDTEKLEDAREVIPWETKRSLDTTMFNYDFATIFVQDMPFDAKKAHYFEKKKLHFKTHLKEDQAKYEEFTILHDLDKKTIVHIGDYVENSCSRIVSKLLDITGLGEAVKEYPLSLFTIHDGERFRHASMKNPDEIRVVYDPFNAGCSIPILKLSPINKQRICVDKLSLTDAMQKPTEIHASPEELHMDYLFLKVIVHYDNQDRGLACYHGQGIDLGNGDCI